MTEEELFARASEMPPGERSAFLCRECGDDEALREGVKELLALFDSGPTLVDGPCVESGSVTVEELIDPSSATSGFPMLPRADGDSPAPFGDYEIEAEIARGTMGVVYRAMQKSLKRSVALKMIRGTFTLDEHEVTRFRLEAEAAASLDHPNIVPVYEIGEHGGQQYYSMKLIEGGTLADQRERLRRDPRSAVQLMAKVARAIHAAHQQGVLHRDIKPKNILVDESGEPHVTDFGLAKQMESDSGLTHSGEILGTPYFMAPEQAMASGTTASMASDVYSLGAIFYELLSGKPPHQGETMLQTLRLVIDEEPRPLHEIDRSVDRDLETVVFRCLEKVPAHRYPSAAALADELDRWLNGEPIQARPTGAVERAVKWTRRKPVNAAAWGLAAVLLLTFGIGGPIIAVHQSKLRLEANEEKAIAEQRARENRRNLYFSEMNLASQFGTDTGGIRRLRALVKKWIPKDGEEDLRGWEWYYLNAVHRHDVLSLAGHKSAVESVSWRPGGRHIASADLWGEIRVWHAESGEEILQTDDHAADKAPTKVAWSRDGSALASGDTRGRMDVRNPETGEIRWSKQSPAGSIYALGWRPNGRHVAFGFSNGEIEILNAQTGKRIQKLAGDHEAIDSLSWATNSRLATSHGGAPAQIWQAPPGKVLLEPFGEEPVRRMEWSPNGQRLAGEDVNGSHDLLIIEPGSQAPALRMRGHYAQVGSVAWSPDGMRLASASRDGSVRLWDTETGKAELVIPAIIFGGAISWSPDGKQIAFGEGNRIRVCDVAGENHSLRVSNHSGQSLQWSPDGNRFATSGRDGTVRLWVASDLTLSRLLRGNGGPFYDVAWNPQRNLLASAGAEGIVWDSETGEERYRINAPPGHTRLVQWSPDGNRLAVVENIRDVRVRDAASGDEIAFLSGAAFDLKSIRHLEWSPGGDRLAVTAVADGIRIWETSEFELVATLAKGEDVFGDMAWSPDGTQLAVGTISGSIRTLDAATGETVVELLGHESAVSALAWSPDGARLASGGFDRTIRLWDVGTGAQCLAILAHDEAVYDIAWSQDGSRLLSRGREGDIKIWEGNPDRGAEIVNSSPPVN